MEQPATIINAWVNPEVTSRAFCGASCLFRRFNHLVADPERPVKRISSEHRVIHASRAPVTETIRQALIRVLPQLPTI